MHDSFILNYPSGSCINASNAINLPSTSTSTAPPMVVNGADNGAHQSRFSNSLLESLISQANGVITNGSSSNNNNSYHFTAPLVPSGSHDLTIDANDGEEEEDDGEDTTSTNMCQLVSATNGCNGTATATPAASNNSGEGAHEVVQRLAQEVEVMKSGMLLLNHQIKQIMSTLGVPTCMCVSCKAQRRRLRDEKRKTLDEQKRQRQLRLAARLASAAVATTALAPTFAPVGRAPMSIKCEGHAVQSPVGVFVTEPKQRGRRSKYCHSASEKRAVAEFARLYGAGAAARKFNIPSSVAAYYQRKKFCSSGHGGASAGVPNWQTEAAGQVAMHGNESLECATASNLDLMLPLGGVSANGLAGQDTALFSAVGGMLDSPTLWTMPGAAGAVRNADSPSTPTTANSSLRGRSRGRPKLIGDELDSELVEYLMEVKRSQPHPQLYLSSAQVLQIARRFIAERAPGLLVEEGGSVKLRHTWAAKLLARIAEREKELGMAGRGAAAVSNSNWPTNSTNDASSMTLSELLMATAQSRNATAEATEHVSPQHHCLMPPTPPEQQQPTVEGMPVDRPTMSALAAEIAAANSHIAHFEGAGGGQAGGQEIASNTNEQFLQQHQNALLKSLLDNLKKEPI